MYPFDLKGTNRRHFLRNSATTLALPFLPSLAHRAFAAEKMPVAPKRLVFFSFGFGVTQETWFPGAGEKELSPGLAPLKRHRERLSLVQGLSNQFNNEGHWGSTFYLTGANRYAVPGQSFHNTISADQVAAVHLGEDTRFASLQLGCADAESSGHGPGLSLAWNAQGKPIAGHDTPMLAFHKLFGGDDMPLAKRQALIEQKRSALDTLRGEVAAMNRRLNAADRDKLDEYLQSIREIEARIAKESAWLGKPKPKQPFAEPEESLEGWEEIQMMHDIMLAALQSDSTRVITYRQPVGTLLKSLDISVAAHDMSHYTEGVRKEASQARDLKQSELLARFLDKLSATKQADGSSLLDHTLVSYGSNIRHAHTLDDVPALIAGGPLRHGQNITKPKHTPLCNLWLTLLRCAGVPAESHGDSNGIIQELIA